MNNFHFSKKKRLTSLNFNFIFNHPNKIKNKYFTILSHINKLKYSRIGIIIPKKKIKKTNIRNKFKRIIREYFRLNQYIFYNMDYIIMINNKNILKINNFYCKIYLEKIWNIYKIN
ncbi:ribonuclease P protein component [Enterobacteriaceae endosymbiont of Donacia clavipes]|uniref:ribonuclease P protein component n=1 Tax=Enterobacteriaceae endosymbiont of Donacia clavipes TaxID=2675775 RepID=UPI00144A06AF|nr:ribonuclease P protein component [Enterobacteriaceae endosymbiont of Donacia clavipes]QJC33479.1 ribonuclease P protein component [Enterobacteriaceae endosymbiont of Donacia clavipes]